MKGRMLSLAEKEYIANHAHESPKAIAEALGRPQSTIRVKLMQLRNAQNPQAAPGPPKRRIPEVHTEKCDKLHAAIHRSTGCYGIALFIERGHGATWRDCIV